MTGQRDRTNDDPKTSDSKDSRAIRAAGSGDSRREATPGSDGRPAIGGGAKDDIEAGTRVPAAAGGQGSLGAATYNDSGNLTGPDSPAGEEARRESDGGGQGDDLADQLGGGKGRGTGLSGAGAATGDMRADRSEEDEERPIAEGIGDDPGAPGGMGGARARPAGIGRPPGGDGPMR